MADPVFGKKIECEISREQVQWGIGSGESDMRNLPQSNTKTHGKLFFFIETIVWELSSAY